MSDNEVVTQKKTISVADFKNWLSGIREFQPEDWVPNLDQWHKILNKIEDIEESVRQAPMAPPNNAVRTNEFSNMSPPNNQAPQHSQQNPSRNRPQAPLDSGGMVRLPDKPTKIVPKQITVEKVGVPTRDAEGKVLNTGEVYKTGVIDTSKRDYESQFV